MDINDGFSIFWKHYPKKVGKIKSEMEWGKLHKKGKLPSLQFILSRLEMQIAHKKRCKEQNIFCAEFPDPERWIKYQRWDDEVSDEGDKPNIKQSPAQRAAEARLGEGGGTTFIEGEFTSHTQYSLAMGANAKH